MSKKKLQFIWIDDNSERKEAASLLEEATGSRVSFFDLNGKDLDESLNTVITEKEPDLVIVDHKLEDVESGLFKLGSTAAAFLREKWEQCPIVCVSGVDKSQVSAQQKILYQEMYPISSISNHYETLVSIAKGYLSLKAKAPQQLADIPIALAAPTGDHSRLTAVLPSDVKLSVGTTSFSIQLSAWLRDVLFARPGFLYDRLNVATLLGIKESSFYKIENKFKSALYKGVFGDNSNPRWWKSEVLKILQRIVTGKGFPWQLGRQLSSVNKNDYSICYIDKAEYPEVVAFVDETPSAARHPMHLRETIAHPRYENLLFFDEVRVMKPAE